MELTGDNSFRIWPLPYYITREEIKVEGSPITSFPVDARTLFRIRLHCQFANPGCFTSVMFITEGDKERLHIAIQDALYDVTNLIKEVIGQTSDNSQLETIANEKFPYTWFPLFHISDLPAFYEQVTLNYLHLRKHGKLVYLDLNKLTEPINHAPIYYEYSDSFIKFLHSAEEKGLIKIDGSPTSRRSISQWQLRSASAILFPEGQEYLSDWQNLYLSPSSLSSQFLLERLANQPFYFFLGSSPVYLHFFSLTYGEIWVIDGTIEITMTSYQDWLKFKDSKSLLTTAQGSVYLTTQKIPTPKTTISKTQYYAGPSKKLYYSFLFPINSIPDNLL